MLLGHANPAVSAAIADQAQKGTSYGVTTELEVQLAQRIRRVIPFMEKIRFVSSGTEATMSALRLARGFTGRDLVIKFEGCYHGHADSFLSQAGSGLATLGIAECPVVPLGPVYQAGTLAGNPLAMRAGIATLDQLSAPGLYERIEKLAATLVASIREILRAEKITGHVNAAGSLATLFFTQDPVNDYSDAKKSDTKRYTQYFRNMLERGVFLAPSQFEASFVSVSHAQSDIEFAIKAAQESLHLIATS